jgi:RNA polymerase sigma-70 factor, ECF subfamily
MADDSGALEDSFREFVRDRGEQHRRMAVLLAGEWHTGQDLIQASLILLHKAWPRIDTAVGADAYLHRIMVNQQRSWRRARWRSELPAPDIPDAVASEDHAAQHAAGSVVRAALARLPYKQRAVLVLRYFADLSEAETASVLGCSVSTVKTHAARGMQAMRTRLGAEFGQPQGRIRHEMDELHGGEVHA